MLSEKQHIDDFFRRKEEAFTPDEQPIDAHWQQMRAQLADPDPTPGNAKAGSNISRHFNKFLGGLITVIIIAVLAINPFRSHKKIVAQTKQSESTVAVTTNKEVKQERPIDSLANTTTKAVALPGLIDVPIATSEDYNSGSDADLPIPPPVEEKPDAYTLLQAFYKKLEKPEQEFYIEADRDTTLIAKEGTQLLVPANTLMTKGGPVKGPVKIVIREYYRNEDIIAARLHTLSNGQQLETGGMLHISAEQDGVPVLIAPQKTIIVTMPANNYDSRMQLFMGQEIPDDVSSSTELNWIPAEPVFQGLMNCGSGRKILALNVNEVEPFSVNYGKRTVAKFYMSDQVFTPKPELIAQLKQRFGSYYDVIKIRRARKNKNYENAPGGKPYVIDSTPIDVKAKLASKKATKQDSLRLFSLLKQDSVYNYNQALMSNTYRFAISSFGYINCDRFLDDPRPKVTMTVNFGEGANANNYVSMLLFTRYRTFCRGYGGAGHTIFYKNIPEDEPALLITVTVNDDKVVSNIQSFTTSHTVANNFPFEPVTPEQFKQKLESLLASQKQ